jgi:hypothetical protein
MTTAIEDSELNTELQELYLVSKQWIADLEFLDSELDFLQKLADNHSNRAIRSEELAMLGEMEKTYGDLKTDILNYLHQLEPLITEKQRNFDLCLIETYTQLKQRLSEVLLNCIVVKNAVFEYSKFGFKEGQLPISS